jgi:O-antigen ligase/Flp pilus assembly protein TadD
VSRRSKRPRDASGTAPGQRLSRDRSTPPRPRAKAETGNGYWIDQLGVWLLVVTAVALPLAFDPRSTFPFPIAKAGVLGIVSYALGATLALKVLTTGLAGLPRTWLLAPPAAFLALTAIAAVLAVDHNIALWGAYDRRLGLVAAVQMGVIFLAAATFVRGRGDLLTVLGGVAGGGLLVVSYGIAQRLGVDPIRWPTPDIVFATFGNSNIMGQYFAVLAAASIAGFLGLFPLRRSRTPAIMLAIASIAFVTGVVLSGARAALIGLSLGAGLAVALGAWRLASGSQRVVAAGLTVAAVIVGGVAILLTPVGARIATLAQGTDLSVSERSLLYRTIFEIVADRPLLGVGPDNLAAVYNLYRPVEALPFGPLLTQSSAHGWPFRTLLDSGALGLLAFLAIALSLVLAGGQAIRRSAGADPALTVLFVGLITYLVAGVFAVNDLGTDWLFWLAAGIVVATLTGSSVRAAGPLRGWHTAVAVVLAVGVIWPVLALTRDIGASRALLASRSLADRDPGAALVQARQVVEADDRWPDHWNSLGLRARAAGDRELALTSFEHAARIGPYDPLIWGNLGTLEAQLAANTPAMRDRAVVSARRSVQADPRNPRAHAAAAQIHLVLGDAQTAVGEVEQALALTPTDDLILEVAAAAYLQIGRLAEARTAIETALRTRETWERRLLLARVHVADGRTADARAQLLRVLEIDPGNRTATSLLAQIGR